MVSGLFASTQVFLKETSHAPVLCCIKRMTRRESSALRALNCTMGLGIEPFHGPVSGQDVIIYPFNLPFYLVIDMVSETKASRGRGTGEYEGEEDEKAERRIEEDTVFEVEERNWETVAILVHVMEEEEKVSGGVYKHVCVFLKYAYIIFH